MSKEQETLKNIDSICGSFLFDDYPLSSWGNYETCKDRIVAEFKLDDDFATLKQALEDLELYKKALDIAIKCLYDACEGINYKNAVEYGNEEDMKKKALAIARKELSNGKVS